MRFNDQQHLDDWRNRRRFPKIHDEIGALVLRTHPRTGGHLDICTSIGMLAARVQTFVGVPTYAVDADTDALTRARAAGVDDIVDLREMKLTMDTIPDLAALIAEGDITAITARRCLSEIFANPAGTEVLTDYAAAFRDTVADAGVTDIWTQGRTVSKNTVHVLGTGQAEIDLLAPRYTVAHRTTNCYHLRLT